MDRLSRQNKAKYTFDFDALCMVHFRLWITGLGVDSWYNVTKLGIIQLHDICEVEKQAKYAD